MAVVIDIKNLPEGKSQKRYSLTPDEFAIDYADIRLAGELVLTADLTKHNDQVIFRGHLSVPTVLVCARCAEEFEKVVEADLVFVLKQVSSADEAGEGDSEDFFLIPDNVAEFDVSDLIREQIILQINLKPLCREDCRGICPHCGQNLNEKQCDCRSDEIDPRWQRLKELTDRS